jgi:hypothetical protein
VVTQEHGLNFDQVISLIKTRLYCFPNSDFCVDLGDAGSHFG